MFTIAHLFKNSSDIPDVPPSGEHTDWLEVSGAGVAEVNGLYQRTAGTSEQPLKFEKVGTTYNISYGPFVDPGYSPSWYIFRNDLGTEQYSTGTIEHVCPCDSSLSWSVCNYNGATEPLPTIKHVYQTPSSDTLDFMIFYDTQGNGFPMIYDSILNDTNVPGTHIVIQPKTSNESTNILEYLGTTVIGKTEETIFKCSTTIGYLWPYIGYSLKITLKNHKTQEILEEATTSSPSVIQPGYYQIKDVPKLEIGNYYELHVSDV